MRHPSRARQGGGAVGAAGVGLALVLAATPALAGAAPGARGALGGLPTAGQGETGADRAVPKQGVTSSVSLTPYVDCGMLLGPAQALASMGLFANTAPISGSNLDANMGLAVGLAPRVTLDGSLGTLSMAPETRYQHPEVGMWLGLINSPAFELDATAHVRFGPGEDRVVSRVEPGAQGILRFGHAIRLDLGGYVPISPGETLTVGLRAPAKLAVQLGPYVHAQVNSGVTVDNLAQTNKTLGLPLGFSLGVRVPLANGGSAGLSPSVSWGSVAGPAGLTPATIGATVVLVTPP